MPEGGSCSIGGAASASNAPEAHIDIVTATSDSELLDTVRIILVIVLWIVQLVAGMGVTTKTEMHFK